MTRTRGGAKTTATLSFRLHWGLSSRLLFCPARHTKLLHRRLLAENVFACLFRCSMHIFCRLRRAPSPLIFSPLFLKRIKLNFAPVHILELQPIGHLICNWGPSIPIRIADDLRVSPLLPRKNWVYPTARDSDTCSDPDSNHMCSRTWKPTNIYKKCLLQLYYVVR